MDSPVRLRLVFEHHRNLLNKTQRSEGLKRSWVLLKPEFETISDLSSYLTHTFDLHQACPNGIALSMDGFVLPWFESARIFKDKDIIRVKRKEGTTTGVIRIGDDANSLEDSEIVEKQPLLPGVKLLALEEFEKEIGGYQSEPEENEYDVPEKTLPLETPPSGKATSKKRKSSTKLQSAKRRRVGSSPEQSSKVSVEGVENDDQEKNQDLHHKGALSQKSSYKKNKSSKSNATSASDVGGGVENNNERKRARSASPEKPKKLQIEDIGNEPQKLRTEGVENGDRANNKSCDQKGARSQNSSHRKDRSSKTNAKFKKASIANVSDGVENNVECMPSKDRKDQRQKNNLLDVEGSAIPEGTLKRPSRSARRKKAKRKWKQELLNSQRKELTQGKIPEESVHNKSQELQESDKNTDSEAEVVPIVVKPGHIRFEPISEDKVIRQTPDPVGTFQWNGTMSKKKGQKWGMEKTSVSRSNSYEVSRKESCEKTTIEEGELVHDSVDFEKLKPLSCLPKEGDIVAYRLVELSSSWCPELSPFRVGKISWYDSESNRIMLVPVPGFPIVSDAKRDADNEEETAQETQSSLYKEDGSLEIDFVSLIDVRMFNYGDFDPASVVTDGNNEAPASNEEAGWGNNKAPASNKEAGCGNNKATASNKETGCGNSKAPASDKEAGWNNRKAPASNKEAGWSTNKATASNKETGWGNSKAPASNQEAGCRNSKAPASNKEAGWGATAANDKHEEATLVTNGSNAASNKESGSGWKSKVTHEERQASTTGNDKSLDVWEEISQALNEKKSQLSQKNGWGDKKAGSSKGQWSYKALRSSALGPTMAILRAGNGK